MPRPPPPAGGLDDDGVAVLAGEDAAPRSSWSDRLGACRAPPGRRPRSAARRPATLSPRLRCISAGGADEGDAGLLAGVGEVGVLGQEAVPGVDGVDPDAPGQLDDLVDAQVGVDGLLALADQVGLVGLVAVQGEPVLLRVDGDRGDAQLGAGAEDADGDLAAVGGHNFSEPFLCYSHLLSPSFASIYYKIAPLFVNQHQLLFIKLFRYYRNLHSFLKI